MDSGVFLGQFSLACPAAVFVRIYIGSGFRSAIFGSYWYREHFIGLDVATPSRLAMVKDVGAVLYCSMVLKLLEDGEDISRNNDRWVNEVE